MKPHSQEWGWSLVFRMKPRSQIEVSYQDFMCCFHTQAPSKGRITDLVTTGRALIQAVTYFLQLELPTLEPVSIQCQLTKENHNMQSNPRVWTISTRNSAPLMCWSPVCWSLPRVPGFKTGKKYRFWLVLCAYFLLRNSSAITWESNVWTATPFARRLRALKFMFPYCL